MRIVTSLLVLVVLVLGAFAVARAHDDPSEKKLLQDRLEALEAQVEYLRAREQALTGYVLQNAQRAEGLEEVARRARLAGFEANRVPVDSRKILLKGMESLAVSLRQDLPKLTKEQQALLKKPR